MHPLERLINLVALLLESSRPLTFDEIRERLPAWQQEDRDTAKRQFERDKDTLRQIGIPIEVVPTDAWEVQEGYVIARDRYALPDISFTSEEAAALFVAAHQPGGHGEAAQAFRKLALGVETGVLSSLRADGTAGVDVSGPHLHALADAVARRRRVRFRYRPVRGRAGQRDVDAWALVFRRGAWYLVGRDRKRREPRSFRLSRILSRVGDAGPGGAPPEGFRAAEQLAVGPWGLGEPQTTARLAFSPKVAWWALAEVPGARTVRTRRGGWIEAEVPAGEGESFVSWVLSFGPDAEVLAPRGLRDSVVAALEAVRASL
jgi:proteasome accessory factor B